MKVLRPLIPASALAKTRLAALIFAIVSTVPHLAAANPTLSAPWRLGGNAALLLLVALYVITFARRRTFLLDPPVVFGLLILAGSTREDPDTVIGMCLGALVLLSMHGSLRQTLTRLVLVVGALLISMELSPAAGALGMTWHSKQNVGLVPMLVVLALLNAAVQTLLLRQQSAAARESLLARTGLELINLTNLDGVSAAAGNAFRTACAEWPDHTALVLRQRSDSMIVEAAVATSPDVVGDELPTLAPSGLATTMTRLDDDQRQVLNALSGGSPDDWWGLAFGGDVDDLFLFVRGRAMPTAMNDTLRTLATYWSLAEANCRTHEELGHRADSDQLTALHNRRWFLQRLASAREDISTETGCQALLMIDLDDFKQVNDTYGHAAGDGLLVSIAQRITTAAGVSGWPARLGGDEFALLLTGLEDPAAADRAAEALRELLLEPVRLPEAIVTVGASIGIAIASPELTAGDLMRCADIAMYSAKAKGKNRVERFEGERHGSVAQIRRIEEHLTHALARDEITVHYQPRVDIDTGRCLGLEALARWHDPSIGPVEPTSFIPMAIRTGQIKSLGRRILRTACAQLAAWHADPEWRELTMSVNIAAPQLYDPLFVDTVRHVLDETGVSADRLILELAEEPAIDLDRATAPLVELADLGVRIALDNFGTGNASFAVLRAFPVHQLKIHQKLVGGVDSSDHAMVQIIIAAGSVLGIETVAGCVETPLQAKSLRESGVTAAQGYLFAPPMSADALTAWLTSPNEGAPDSPIAVGPSHGSPA